MYPAAGEAKKATAAATSSGVPKRPAGISASISFWISSTLCPVDAALPSIMETKRWVNVAPGKTLLTVIPQGANSTESVLDQLATAARIVLLTPNPRRGALTDVDITLIIRP